MNSSTTTSTRRSFVCGAAAGMAALAGVATTHAHATENQTEEWYTPGIYASVAQGHNTKFTVSCTFTDHALTAIDTDGNSESMGVGKVALELLSDQIVRNQSLNVDAVTGATITSNAFLYAVEDCAEQAGGVERLRAAEVAPAQIASSYDADICIVGGGGAGLCAAVSAVQAGASVVVLEKCGYVGGSTNVSTGCLNAVDPARQEEQGIEDSIPQFYASTFYGGKETADPALVAYLANNALDSCTWLERLGVRFKEEMGAGTGSLGQRGHYPFNATGNSLGNNYITPMTDYLANHADKATILTNVQVTELLQDENGAVVGARGTHSSGTEITVNAKSVIVATGGFGANYEYRQSVNDGVWKEIVLDESVGCTNIHPCAQGEGLFLAEKAGAKLVSLSDIQLHPNGTPGVGLSLDVDTGGRNRIFVNSNGERFVSEGDTRIAICKAIFQQPGQTYYIIVNSVRYPDPAVQDENGFTINGMIDNGRLEAGQTVEELANACGMDPAKLQASIDAYNAVVRGEAEDEFGFVADNTADRELLDGPWYACRKVPTVHHTMGGIRINVNAEACDADGNPIPGLYAAGEVAGGIHGSNRLGGNAIADVFTFGRCAGVHAAMNAGYEAPAPATNGSSPVGSVSIEEARDAALAAPTPEEEELVESMRSDS